ncbi:hypothetical protein OA5_05990 [Vibrio cyclitrophicus 1F111]|uniref:WecB/TagA/CpsF family glycosyltransferase n=1 Tax=Vibrio cyclitrophicus TaxID=47951 RepID=UPI0002D4DBA8|nr:WecB/TagA/CpsF family glycosyltransferase [Vibrio cyclitrophicus]OEF75425.1 hypothetical protein OA5_05990 [Vibrio cyclitrophicus 1F111]
MIKISTTENVSELYRHINHGSDLLLVTFVNAFSYYDMSREMQTEIDYFFSDGILLTKLNNVFYSDKVERLSFDSTSLAYPCFEFFEKNEVNVALVGANKDEINNFSKFIKNKFPLLKLKYVSSGYIKDEDKREVLERSLESDVIIVGMGFPYQEDFLLELKRCHRSSSQLKLALTCGGFFTQHQDSDYYPKIIDKLELRWLYRIIFAKHVRRKFFTKYPHFILRYIINALF